ncbi:hypothetical protein HBH56_169870 [Parastagonospora nodorum]|nr:hypothetical protein HBH56_169870 [Parastagonospora nodorum]KAH3928263.1 hypothetical protein HBH54_138420 [Parastagonospora nodorum]KAH3945449.1 hypothetical protein HBH53_143770 [Parastagonospora nodorum]KAH3985695.1 hypothetical protein HBH51_019280 [Parastagonospora nodorum]KAH4003538.1 hypothetical protein HBI10_058440 [Parastagonospora nodorum]
MIPPRYAVWLPDNLLMLELRRFRIGLGGSRKLHVFSLSPLGTWIRLRDAASCHLSASEEDPGTLITTILYTPLDCH